MSSSADRFAELETIIAKDRIAAAVARERDWEQAAVARERDREQAAAYRAEDRKIISDNYLNTMTIINGVAATLNELKVFLSPSHPPTKLPDSPHPSL